jgi:hypothetical protein
MAKQTTKLIVDNDALAEAFFEDTRLMGIVSGIKNYRFCWHLNQLLGVDFRLSSNIDIQLTKRNRKYFFSVYEFQEPNSTLGHYLYHNQYDGEYLLPEFKHLDFIWLMKGDWVNEEIFQQMIQSLRNLAGVQVAVELKTEMVKNKVHLIF